MLSAALLGLLIAPTFVLGARIRSSSQANTTSTVEVTGTAGKCIRFAPDLGVDGAWTEDAGKVPSLVLITIKSAQHLPWKVTDKADPHVEFWMGDKGKYENWLGKKMNHHHDEKYWRARTRTLNDNLNPTWEWKCLMSYDAANPMFHAVVWDADYSANDFIAETNPKGVNLFNVMQQEDKRNDAEVEIELQLFDKKEQPMKDNTVLRVEFEIIREPKLYALYKMNSGMMNNGLTNNGMMGNPANAVNVGSADQNGRYSLQQLGNTDGGAASGSGEQGSGGSLLETESLTASVAGGSTALAGLKRKCPRFEPWTAGDSSVTKKEPVPNLVRVTIKSAQHLPCSWCILPGSKPDPHVEFWMGDKGKYESWLGKKMPGHHKEKYWRARTQTLNNNVDPTWESSCVMFFDAANPMFHAVVWDADTLSKNDFIGETNPKGVNLFDLLQTEDKRNDGHVQVKMQLHNKKGKPVGEAVLHVEFEVIREPKMYALHKVVGGNPMMGGGMMGGMMNTGMMGSANMNPANAVNVGSAGQNGNY